MASVVHWCIDFEVVACERHFLVPPLFAWTLSAITDTKKLFSAYI